MLMLGYPEQLNMEIKLISILVVCRRPAVRDAILGHLKAFHDLYKNGNGTFQLTRIHDPIHTTHVTRHTPHIITITHTHSPKKKKTIIELLNLDRLNLIDTLVYQAQLNLIHHIYV